MPDEGDGSEWVTISQRKIGADGRYAFAGLDLVNDEGKSYRYRLRYEKPDGTFYAPLDMGDNDDVDNDWFPVVEPENPTVDLSPLMGTTQAYEVVKPLFGNTVNAYGQLWQAHRPINHQDEEDEDGNPTGSSVDFGFTYPPTVKIAGTVWEDADHDDLRNYELKEVAPEEGAPEDAASGPSASGSPVPSPTPGASGSSPASGASGPSGLSSSSGSKAVNSSGRK